jgi:hypothetical protein
MSSGRDLHGWDIEQDAKFHKFEDDQRIIDNLHFTLSNIKPGTRNFEKINWVRINFSKIWAMRKLIECLEIPDTGRNEGKK